MARAAIEAAFDALELPWIVALALPQNLASRRVMEKTGFTYQRDIDYAFKNGKSLDEIGQWLNQRISATLRNHGVPDDQRQAILDQLQQTFAEGGSKSDVRQSVTTYLQQVADYLDPTAASAASSPESAAAPLGQTVDFTA